MIIKRLVIFLCILFVNSKCGADDGVSNVIDDNRNMSEIDVEITGNVTDDNRNRNVTDDNGNRNVTDDNRNRNTSITITNSGVKTKDRMLILCLFSLFL